LEFDGGDHCGRVGVRCGVVCDGSGGSLMPIMLPPSPEDQDRVLERDLYKARAPRTYRPKAGEVVFAAGVFAAEQCQRQGIVVSQDTLCMMSDKLTPASALLLLESDKFQNALDERGILLPENGGLSGQQMHALTIYMDMSVAMSHPQKLRAMGVTDSKWQGWLQQPGFAARISEVSEDRLRSSVPIALQRIHEGVDRGDQKFIELSLEITGRHDRRKETVDVNAILTQIFNVLDEEIPDQETLGRIADRLRRLRDQGLLGGGAPNFQVSAPAPAAYVVQQLESP
jgi:hypothetical protein